MTEQQAALNGEVRQLKNELERKVHMALNSEKSYHRIQATLEKQTAEFGQLQDELENKENEIVGLNGLNNNLEKDTKALRKELIKFKSEAQDLGHHLQDLKHQLDSHVPPFISNPKDAAKIKNELLACKKELNDLKSQQHTQRNHGL